jgi:TIR domain-containing protein
VTVGTGAAGWDFFVSYTQADQAWAEWIAWALEEDGHRVLIQAWDFVPGSNWIRGMDAGTREAARTIAVMSGAYLKSAYGSAEWRAAWASDPGGTNRKLLVVRVEPCDRPQLLAALVGIDLFGIPQADARTRLRAMVAAAATGRAKPSAPPEFPGLSRAVPDEPGFPGTRDPKPIVPGLGELTFSTRVEDPEGQLVVGFGADDTLVLAEKNGAIHRWSLREATELAGLPRGEPLRSGISVVTSHSAPAVAIARARKVTVVHFTRDGYTTADVSLGRTEFLVPACGERFATYDGRRVAVRDFRDGSVLWQQPCPPNVATATIDTTGTAVATASSPNILAGSNKITVVTQDSPRPREFAFDNFPLFGAGCQLGMSPAGDMIACASFREVILIRARGPQAIHRRPLGNWRQEIAPALGTRPQRLICTPSGELLWLRGRRIALVRWTAPELHYLPQNGACDDIAFDPATSRLAIVSQSGQVDVWQWRS